VSSQSQSLSKSLSILLALLFSAVGCSWNRYDYQGAPVQQTPYDAMYVRVECYLKRSVPESAEQPIEPCLVRECFTQSREFRYQTDETALVRSAFAPDYWQLPSQTEQVGCGDCEDLSIWLYAKLIERGVPNVRLVVGKGVASDHCLHAWVMWFPGDKAYILDPTANRGIGQARRYPAGYYQPRYSFSRGQKWYHREPR